MLHGYANRTHQEINSPLYTFVHYPLNQWGYYLMSAFFSGHWLGWSLTWFIGLPRWNSQPLSCPRSLQLTFLWEAENAAVWLTTCKLLHQTIRAKLCFEIMGTFVSAFSETVHTKPCCWGYPHYTQDFAHPIRATWEQGTKTKLGSRDSAKSLPCCSLSTCGTLISHLTS